MSSSIPTRQQYKALKRMQPICIVLVAAVMVRVANVFGIRGSLSVGYHTAI